MAVRLILEVSAIAVLLAVGVIGPAAAGIQVTVPEPASLGLLAVGAGVVAAIKFRRRK